MNEAHNAIRYTKWAMQMATNAVVRKEALLKMSYFVFMLTGNDGFKWLLEQIGKPTAIPLKPIIEKTTLNGAVLEYAFSPSQKTYTLAVSPLKL